MKRTERGFTLVELVITMTLMGVVTLALADLVTTALRQISATSDRMDMAQDEQLGATYFARDVAAVGLRDYGTVGVGGAQPFKQSVQLAAPFTAGGVTCGPLPDAAVRLLSDHWDTSVIPAVRRTAVVAYYLQGGELHRASCVGPGTAPASDVRVAANIKPGSLTVSCSTVCTSTSVPLGVTLRFVLSKPAAGEYPVVLSGLRRQS
ncbi:prepilin-type N-terminal cleavage/methylation domain-containing protein [Kribbella antibiotica]|uniref:Prepilin-type N-terminal cleavage/methylation domain-containing protein n=1 Tax=Kribbella antibiotica TaxID=190195 RepID=A0A4R4ZMM7_9ACTN|nr:prepilin-type N-terminal cleavage/methylation domain-containing protein [Kribbella antibiotica]TDD60101.1 prepilin-type N-terminal cleavage/methylation domain-containing protein [Kribbella antibiotica]